MINKESLQQSGVEFKFFDIGLLCDFDLVNDNDGLQLSYILSNAYSKVQDGDE